MGVHNLFSGQFNYTVLDQPGVKTYSFRDKTQDEVNKLRRQFNTGNRTFCGECIRQNNGKPVNNIYSTQKDKNRWEQEN